MKTFSIAILFASFVTLSGCSKTSSPGMQTNSGTAPSPIDQLPNPAGGTTIVAEVKYFRGSIGNTLGLQMKLTREGEKVSGNYYYQKVGTKIDLKGTIDKDSNITLEEFDKSGKQTGIFKGLWRVDNEDGLISIAGNWTRLDGEKKTAFSLHQEPIDFSGGAEIGAKAIKETNKKLRYEINAEYPQVTASLDSRFDKFNQEARSLVAGKVAGFRREMNEAAQEEQTDPGSESTGSDLSISYKTGLATDDLISVQFDVGSYFQGAAHPNSYTQVLNYDVRSGKVLKLADLFKAGAKYLQTLSSYAIKDLKKQSQKGPDSMLDNEWIEKGAGVDAKNYQSWTITRKGLGINFDSYQVGPYAAGPQYVLIPYSALKDIVKPDGPVAQFVK